MKNVLIGLFLFAACGAFASCEDGTLTAQDQALNALYKSHRALRNQCTAAAEDPRQLGNSDESYEVVISCKDRFQSTFIYSVTLHEIEDGFCRVKSVQAVGVSG